MTRKEKLAKMIDSEPQDPFLRFGLAMEYAKEGNTMVAVEHFDHALRLDPNYCVAYYHKARTLADSGEFTRARSVIHEGVRVAQSISDAHTERELYDLLSSLPD